MAYTVKLWDKTTIVITDEQAEIVKNAKLNGIKSISINGNVYDSSSISQIVKGGSLPLEKNKQIESGNIDRRASFNSEGYKKFQDMKSKILGKKY